MPDEPEVDPPVSRAHRYQANQHSQVPLIVVTVIALAALGLAGWTFYQQQKAADGSGSTANPQAGDFTDAQRADAKNTICTAFQTVRTGVSQNTNLQPPGGPEDVTGALAVAANARLSLADGGQYLLARVDPATPQELADAVRTFANHLLDIGAAATAGVPNSDEAQAARLRDADEVNGTVGRLCA